MGCQCLGPKRSQQQVYIKLFKEIYSDCLKIPTSQLSKSDTYNIVYQRIIKKGQLKKLTDNLSSRKHKIKDAFLLNYKLVTQNKELVRLCCGLIIINSISQIIYQKQVFKTQLSSKTDDNTSEQSFKRDSISKFTQKTLKQSSKTQQSHHKNVTIQIDQQYLKTIKYLDQSQPILKKKILQNINYYCDHHTGFITCQSQVWRLILVLMQDIKKDIQSQLNCRTFKNLLLHTRDQINQFIKNRQILQFLLYIWLRQQNNLDQSQTKSNCFQILQIYVVRFMSAWQSQFIYETLFSTFDTIQFDKVQSPLLQKLFEDLVDCSQYQKSFQRNIFNYLLGYLSITQQNYSIRKKLISSLGIKIDNIKSLFPNSTKSGIKIECLKRMNAWVDKEYIDIDQFCIYNSKALIYVYILVLIPFRQQKFTTQAILKQFGKIFVKLLPQAKIRLIQIAIQEIYQPQLTNKQQLQLLLLIREMLTKQYTKNLKIKYGYLFIRLNQEQQHTRKKNIMKINNYVLNLLTQRYTYVDISQQINVKIIQLLYSFYKNIVQQNQSINNFEDKYQLLESFVAFIRELNTFKKNILLAYYLYICDKFVENIKKYSIQIQFCVLVYGFSIRNVLTGLPIPDKVESLRRKIQQKYKKSQYLPQLNQYFFNKDNLIFNIKIQQKQHKQFQQFYKKYINNQTNKYEMDNMLELKKQQFIRQNSMLSENQSMKQSEDSSFQDVINFIR